MGHLNPFDVWKFVLAGLVPRMVPERVVGDQKQLLRQYLRVTSEYTHNTR